jgi:GTP 3',8-cyclase
MFDKYNRQINYLRISVTDRCNLRCYYCMPECGVELMKHDEILRFEEILEVVKEAVKHGITKVRITGGEPLVRKGIVDFIKMLAEIPEIKDLAMTTNGIFLSQYAMPLKEAGLKRLNISLDSMDPEKFKTISRGGDLNLVIQGIHAAKIAGFNPIKINCVVINSSSEKDAREVKEFCDKNQLEVRYIHMMSLSKGTFSVVEGGSGGDCINCSRLRLTADGKLKPCLFSNIEYDVRKLGVNEAIRRAVENKPEYGSVNNLDHFHNIGG